MKPRPIRPIPAPGEHDQWCATIQTPQQKATLVPLAECDCPLRYENPPLTPGLLRLDAGPPAQEPLWYRALRERGSLPPEFVKKKPKRKSPTSRVPATKDGGRTT